MEGDVRLVDRRLAVWLLLLALAQVGDIVTTGIDLSHGTIEGNRFVSGLLATGGLGLLTLLKLSMVAALGVAALLARRWHQISPGQPSLVFQKLVGHGIQVSTVLVSLVVLNNVALLVWITFWS